MPCKHSSATLAKFKAPTSSAKVYKDECTQCFESALSADCLLVCLECWILEQVAASSSAQPSFHAQLMFLNGEFFLKDTKSLGGTFINSSRLSPAGKESHPHKIFHDDDLQFGVDYRPDQRTDQMKNKDKCVKVIVEYPSLVKKQKRNIPEPAKWDPVKHQFTE